MCLAELQLNVIEITRSVVAKATAYREIGLVIAIKIAYRPSGWERGIELE